MQRYVCFLRGINISGKNKILMSDLKKSFIELGFSEVNTYLNSGNVVFSSEIIQKDELYNIINQMILEKFDLTIPFYITTIETLEEILKHAPSWWGSNDKSIYDNLIFILPSTSIDKVLEALGKVKEEYENIEVYHSCIYYSFIFKDYQKTNWWKKTVSSNISSDITIRTANTIKKIVVSSK